MAILIVLGAVAGTLTLAVLGLLLLQARKALLVEKANLAEVRSEMQAFRARFPQTLLDVDAEVVRLRKLKDDLEQETTREKEHAEAEIAAHRERVERSRSELEGQIEARRQTWEGQFTQAMSELQRLHKEVEGLNEEAEIQSFALYRPRYDFASVEGYKQQLEVLRTQQKEMIKKHEAAICGTSWEVGGSAAEGRRMIERQLKLMLRAFNGECEAAIASVSWKNVVTLQDRIRKSFEALNKLGETVHCEITQSFLQLRLEELQLGHEYAEKVQADKEEQRHLREQMREDEKANKEIERERDEAERDEERYQRALEQARVEIEKANESQRAALDAKVAKLQSMLAQAQERKQRAISQAELTRLGHVYILSNEGSFGPNVFKIGMTRRLEPMDRVDELGSASVPFRFDVHAIIRSEDAPGLEQKLHEALEPHRVNLVNSRKEYFRVPMEKIVDLVNQHHGKIQFTQIAEAVDFRKTLAIRAEREAMVVGKVAHASAVSRVDEVKARYEELKKATA